MTHTDAQEKTLADRVRAATGVDVRECYQCGKCTAGCPMIRFMDLGPAQVMRLVQVGDPEAVERLLGSRTLWACVGCLTCTQRCPKELDPAAVLDALREMAFRQGRVPAAERRVLRFHQAFLNVVKHTGRMSEVPLTALYKMTSGDLFSDITLAPAMLARGKLPLVPKVIAGRDEVRRIFDRCLGRAEPEPEEPSENAGPASSPEPGAGPADRTPTEEGRP